MALGCYVTYKEAKHHELHKMRACFIDIEKHIEQLKHTKEAEDDPYTMEVFRGEIIGIEKALAKPKSATLTISPSSLISKYILSGFNSYPSGASFSRI